jgi:hypothetical protein
LWVADAWLAKNKTLPWSPASSASFPKLARDPQVIQFSPALPLYLKHFFTLNHNKISAGQGQASTNQSNLDRLNLGGTVILPQVSGGLK